MIKISKQKLMEIITEELGKIPILEQPPIENNTKEIDAGEELNNNAKIITNNLLTDLGYEWGALFKKINSSILKSKTEYFDSIAQHISDKLMYEFEEVVKNNVDKFYKVDVKGIDNPTKKKIFDHLIKLLPSIKKILVNEIRSQTTEMMFSLQDDDAIVNSISSFKEDKEISNILYDYVLNIVLKDPKYLDDYLYERKNKENYKK